MCGVKALLAFAENISFLILGAQAVPNPRPLHEWRGSADCERRLSLARSSLRSRSAWTA